MGFLSPIGDNSTLSIPKDAKEIDLKGKTMIPVHSRNAQSFTYPKVSRCG